MKLKLSDAEPIISEVLESGGEIQIYPDGSSMLPLLLAGRDSVVLVKPQEKFKKNNIILYKRDNGKYVLHRIMKVHNETYVLCGDNQSWMEYGIRDEQIIGVVKYFFRKNKKIYDHSFLYIIYKSIWQSMFLRKLYFKIVKVHRIFAGKDKLIIE